MAAGVDPTASAIKLPRDDIQRFDWKQAQLLARDNVLQRVPERQRRLVELVYARERDEAISDAVVEERARRRAAGAEYDEIPF